MRRTSRNFIEHEKRFCARVRAVRMHRELSHQLLGNLVDMSRMAISGIESGKRRVTLSEALSLADALDVPLADMVSEHPLVVTERVRIA